MKTMPAKSAKAFERHGLSDDQLVTLMRNMLMQRQLDNRGFQLNRQGKIPFALGSEGHEALQAGAAMALDRGRDQVALYYRDLGLMVGFGVPPLDILLSMFARAADRSGGRQFPNHITNKALGVISFSSIIAAHLPHAVGIAYSFKYRKESGRAVMATFGEGSTSEGEWHESMNFAAVHKLPVVFLCENNGYAISVPQEHQMAIKDVADRAAGYGMPSEIVDGMDPIATYAAVKRALDRAHTGGGPTLVEAKCYRFLSHSTDDDDRTYRDREIVNARRKDDPVPAFEKVLVDNGIVTAAAIAKLKRDVLEETNAATDLAESMPLPAPAELYVNLHEGAWEPWQ